MNGALGAVGIVVTSFVAMELVSYAAHRWIMHGFGMGWHRSHHRPGNDGFERNDLFPLCFSSVAITLFALSSIGWAPALFWVGAGVTLYGAAYLFVHEVYIHRRTPLRVPETPYLEWLRDSHGDHHRRGAEPYGMLLPLVRDRGPTSRPGSTDQRTSPTRSDSLS